MERSLEERLETTLKEAPYLSYKPTEVGFSLNLDDTENVLGLQFTNGEWIIFASSGHAHRESFEEALDLVRLLLTGEARFANEYRGKTHAAAWIERRDGNAWEAGDEAAYLSPYETEEWTLAAGESWHVVRRTHRKDAPGEYDEIERTSVAASGGGPVMLLSLERALGTFDNGLRWAVDGKGYLIYPAPVGWRRRTDLDPESEKEHNQVDFGAPDGTMMLRKRNYWRWIDPPSPLSDAQSFAPYSIERGTFDDPKSYKGWERRGWTLLFSDGSNETMVLFELFWTSEAPSGEVDRIADSLATSFERARYIPGDWNMSPEG